MRILFKPIGYVRIDAPDEVVKEKWENLISKIEVLKEFEEALDGIEGFSHIIVLYYLHKISERRTLKVKPRRLVKMGVKLEELPLVGVFATDSPVRPNPIALSIVQLVERNRNILTVKGLDAFNATPVLDIKPYTPDRCIIESKLPEWYTNLLSKVEKLTGRRLKSV